VRDVGCNNGTGERGEEAIFGVRGRGPRWNRSCAVREDCQTWLEDGCGGVEFNGNTPLTRGERCFVRFEGSKVNSLADDANVCQEMSKFLSKASCCEHSTSEAPYLPYLP